MKIVSLFFSVLFGVIKLHFLFEKYCSSESELSGRPNAQNCPVRKGGQIGSHLFTKPDVEYRFTMRLSLTYNLCQTTFSSNIETPNKGKSQKTTYGILSVLDPNVGNKRDLLCNGYSLGQKSS